VGRRPFPLRTNSTESTERGAATRRAGTFAGLAWPAVAGCVCLIALAGLAQAAEPAKSTAAPAPTAATTDAATKKASSTAAPKAADAASTQPKAQVAEPVRPISCIRPLAPEESMVNAPASRRLAEAIALFDQGKLAASYENLRGALLAGLPDPLEKAIAYKYLGFFYCQTKSRALCEKSFEAALLASPGFDLDASEKKNVVWADAYNVVYRRLTTDCSAPEAAGPDGKSGIYLDAPPSGIRSTSAVADGQAPAPALLRFAVRPWGDVYLNGKKWVTTPPVKEVQLAPGKHRIEVRNGKMRPFVQEYVFKPGDQLLLRHDF
jgi:hypothetical protein